MVVPVSAEVNRITIIGVVRAEFTSAIPHAFLIVHIGHRQGGDQAGLDSATPPAPRDISDRQSLNPPVAFASFQMAESGFRLECGLFQ